LFSEAPKTSEDQQFGCNKRRIVRSRKRQQVEINAERIRELAYHLYPDSSMGEEQSFAESVFATAADWRYPKLMSTLFRWIPRASRYIPMDGGFKRRRKQSIGRSWGGWNTKVHLVAASDRSPVMFALSLDEAGDAPEGRKLLEPLIITTISARRW